MRRFDNLHRGGGFNGRILAFQRHKRKTLCTAKQRNHDSPATRRAQGQASDIEIQAKHIQKTKQMLNKILSENTGKSLDIIEKDTDRDNYMTAEEAKKYGLIDNIFVTRKTKKETK